MKVNASTKKTRLNITLSLIVNLFYLNVLWIGTTLLGLIIIGLYPATAAAMKVSRKWLLTKDYSVSYKEYVSYVKEEILSSNLLGYIFTVAGIVFYANYQLLAQMNGSISMLVPISYYILLFLFVSTALWVFPLYVHRDNSLVQTIKNAFIIGILKMPLTLLMLIMIFSLFYISLSLPTMLVFFTFSILSTIWMLGGLKGITEVSFDEK